MTSLPKNAARLEFLVRVVARECAHLGTTDTRLFAEPFVAETVERLADDPDLAERVEAFVGRFGRLQDTLADKLLPALLAALGENIGAQIDNLDCAERLGFIESTEMWLTLRQLRNQMVHEYIEDPVVLANALQAGHEFVPGLVNAADTMAAEIRRRGWHRP